MAVEDGSIFLRRRKPAHSLLARKKQSMLLVLEVLISSNVFSFLTLRSLTW
jgi:hypothetical protein